MNVLIVGGGGREHALAWKTAQSADVATVFVAPGNAGTALEDKLVNVPIDAGDIPALIAFAREQAIDLTIVGPEAPLVAGISDAFAEAGLACFGPSQQAAQLEGSKTFCKDFMRRHDIPTADYASFTDVDAARAYIHKLGAPVVVKADGLAAGKGVVVATSVAEAETAVADMLQADRFGAAGRRVVIEEFLTGEEASFIVMSDGEQVLAFADSQDHKARDDGDKGPNTGGMGAYSPAPVVTGEVYATIMQQVIMPTIKGMQADGMPYTGFLYAGVMIDAGNTPKVLEFNCRLGDPETQAIVLRLQSDLAGLCRLAVEHRLDKAKIAWDKRAAVGVVMAAAGYPADVARGDVISGLDSDFAEAVKVFHAGTKKSGTDIVTNGGRVLCVTALGDDVTAARDRAYHAVQQISCPGMFYRKDIAHRAVLRES
ncbi:MAG: phosphoribosylamine--glycine ligase [Gammaproteobacteria bacterium]